MKLSAVVVTYNRKQLLRECLQTLLSQTRPVDGIIVIDNASTDGTDQVIQIEFPHITYVRLPENTGGAGGFYEGMKLAYEKGYDWIWVMDDDAKPKCGCLENLCHAIQLLSNEKVCIYACHLDPTEKYFTESIAVYESDGSLWRVESYGEALQKARLLQATGGPFLGVLIPSQTIIEVGLPRMDSFIWGDYEYFVRLREHGFRIYYDTKSILIHPKHSFGSVKLPLNLFRLKKPICITVQWPKGPAWKQYYGIRNMIYFGIREKKGSSVLRFIKGIVRGVIYSYVAVSYSLQKFRTFRYCLLGIIDGCIGRMDRKVSIV